MIEFISAKFIRPDNDRPGLCVHLRGDRDALLGNLAVEMAGEIAEEEGWNPNGPGRAGIPSRYAIPCVCDRWFWFYERISS